MRRGKRRRGKLQDSSQLGEIRSNTECPSIAYVGQSYTFILLPNHDSRIRLLPTTRVFLAKTQAPYQMWCSDSSVCQRNTQRHPSRWFGSPCFMPLDTGTTLWPSDPGPKSPPISCETSRWKIMTHGKDLPYLK